MIPKIALPLSATDWHDLSQLRAASPEDKRRILDRLSRKYWPAVYLYLRRRGYNRELADDLTQGFFADVLLGRSLFERARREHGTLRSYLWGAVRRFLADKHRRIDRQHLPDEFSIFQMNTVPYDNMVIEETPDISDEALFAESWTSLVLNRTLRDLEDYFTWSGKREFWEVFVARVLNPILNDQPAESNDSLMTRLSLRDTQQVSNMLMTAKRRFQGILRGHMRQYTDKLTVDEEFQHLFRMLGERSS